MKCIKYYITAIFFVILFIYFEPSAFAMKTDFYVEELPQKEIDAFIADQNISLIKGEPKKQPIECFDVNQKELIALGSSNGEDKFIWVYSKQGDFKYGYSFSAYGSFGIEWDEDNIIIYFVRSQIVVSVNSNGNIEAIFKVVNSVENNTHKYEVFKTQKEIDNTKYILKNDMGILNFLSHSYSQLVVREADGNEIIIYDINTTQLIKRVVLMIFLICFLIYRTCFKKLKK